MSEWESIQNFAQRMAVFAFTFNEMLGNAEFESLRSEWRYYYAALGFSKREVLALELNIAECHDRLVEAQTALDSQADARNALAEIRSGRAELKALAIKPHHGCPVWIYAVPALGGGFFLVNESETGTIADCQRVSRSSFERKVCRGVFRLTNEPLLPQ